METNKYKIYYLSSPKDSNNVRYVGFTSLDLKKRWYSHINHITNDYRGRWVNSLLKQNLKPEIHIIEEFSDYDSWQDKEKYWIKYYKDKGYKLTNGTSGGLGIFEPSKETQKNMSKSRVGQKRSEQTKKKMSEIRKGMVFTQEHRKNLSISHMGIKPSIETRKKRSESLKGIIFSEERKNKISKSQIGKVVKEETRKKLSKALTGKKQSQETILKRTEKTRKIKIEQIPEIEKLLETKSCLEIGKIYNVSYRTISEIKRKMRDNK